MQMSNSTTWWLTLALVAVQGLTSIAWASLGLDPRWVAGIGQFSNYASLLLLFAIHGTVPGVAPVIMPKVVVAFLAIGIAALGLGWPGTAHAQGAPRAAIRLVPPTGDPIKDAKAAINGGQSQSAAKTTCDFNLFAALNAQNVIKSIQDCIGAVQSDISNTFLADIQTALASAQKFNDGSGDQPAVACLKPGLAIVVAGAGVPAIPAVAEIPATATSPAIPAQAAVPAVYAGPITLFQKFREFELAGGPAACKTWTLSTVSGANPLLQ